MQKQAASLNVGFLTSLGLLTEAKGKYTPTEAAIRFVNTRNASDERARAILRPVIEDSWFGTFAKNWFATNPMTSKSDFVRELALYGEVSDMTKKERALEVLVEYLMYAQIIAMGADGNLSSGGGPMGTTSGATASPPSPTMGLRAAPFVAPIEGSVDWQTVQTDDFYVKVRPDPDVLADLRDHLDLLEKKIERQRSKKPTS